MRFLMVLAMALGLAACGSDEAEVRVNQSRSKVYAALSQGSIAEIAAVFPGLAVHRSSPSDDEILYTVPGGPGEGTATLRFTLEPVAGNSATIVHAEVDAPEVTARIDGQTKVFSEARVLIGVQRMLRTFSKDGDAGKMNNELSGVLSALAISTNKDARELVLGGGDKEAALERILGNLDSEMLAEGDPGWGDGGFDANSSDAAYAAPAEDAEDSAAEGESESEAPQTDADWGG